MTEDSTPKTCYLCKNFMFWTEYGTEFYDCKAAKGNLEHLEWIEETAEDADFSPVAEHCQYYSNLDDTLRSMEAWNHLSSILYLGTHMKLGGYDFTPEQSKAFREIDEKMHKLYAELEGEDVERADY